MSESKHNNHALDQACNLANALSDALLVKGRTNAEQLRVVKALAIGTRSMIALIDLDEPYRPDLHAERAEALASNALPILAEVTQLGDHGYDLGDVHVQLDIAETIIEMLDSVIGSSTLGADALDRLGDHMHEELTPFLRLAVRLSDPDKFEFGHVPDAWVQSGARAMTLAAYLSRVIEAADSKVRRSSAPSGLAA